MAVVISKGLFYFCYLSCTVVILSVFTSAQNSSTSISTQPPSTVESSSPPAKLTSSLPDSTTASSTFISSQNSTPDNNSVMSTTVLLSSSSVVEISTSNELTTSEMTTSMEQTSMTLQSVPFPDTSSMPYNTSVTSIISSSPLNTAASDTSSTNISVTAITPTMSEHNNVTSETSTFQVSISSTNFTQVSISTTDIDQVTASTTNIDNISSTVILETLAPSETFTSMDSTTQSLMSLIENMTSSTEAVSSPEFSLPFSTSLIDTAPSDSLGGFESTITNSVSHQIMSSSLTSQLTTTSDVNTIFPSMSVQPSLSSSFVTSSVISSTPTASPTTQAPSTTTTTPSQSTLPSQIDAGLGPNSVFTVETSVTLDCSSHKTDADVRIYMLNSLKSTKAVRDVVIVKNGCKHVQGRRRKRNADKETVVYLKIDALENATVVAENITKGFNDASINMTNTSAFFANMESAFSDPCNAGICSEYFGYKCNYHNSTHGLCTDRCSGETCSGHGTCTTVVEDNVYSTYCICNSEEYYKYEGVSCETKRMKWELAVAIAAGIAGAIIVILIFIMIIRCCRKNKDDFYDYRRPSYEPMSQVMGRPGPAYYRNEGVKSHPGFSNLGYDDDMSEHSLQQKDSTWNPEDSKHTYAKINEQFEKGNDFHIKRPQVSSIRQSATGEVTTGF